MIMSRRIGILLLIIVMALSAAFSAVYAQESGEAEQNSEEAVYDESGAEELSAEENQEAQNSGEGVIPDETEIEEVPSEEIPTEEPPTEVPPTEVPPTEIPPTEVPPTEEPPTEVPPTEVPPTEVPPTEVPPTPEPVIPAWTDINEEQVNILTQLYWQMTNTGRLYSGWFHDGDYAPCSWQGITCENGNIVKLNFENAGYFTIFPDQILSFRELKELRMSDTLVYGPLPDTLFSDLPKLEKLELSGNYFTGEIPELPAAFEVYPMLQTIKISDNLEDNRKSELLYRPEYAENAWVELDPQDYPDTDLTPGLDGGLPADWNRLPILSKVDLSGNTLTGNVPDSFGQIPLTELNFSENGSGLQISRSLYDYWASLGNPEIVLEGLNLPAETTPAEIPAQPTEVPVEPTQVPVQPTEVPVQPTQVPVQPTEVPAQPTEPAKPAPTDVPTEVPPEPTEKPRKRRDKATHTPEPTDTPEPQWYTAQPQPYYPQPGYPQPYYPQPEYPQPYYYPTATPYTYTNPYWQYPTATPYSYYNPSWVYPTATAVYTGQQYVRTPEPTADPASMLGFTYTMTEMTGNNIPMTWRYTGMTQYSINYLDANDQLYPRFAMEWKPASELCNASACNASVQDIPQELLDGGTFSLQLRAQDGSGRTYLSDPVKMQVSVPQRTPEAVPTPEPEPKRSFWGGFFHWLFGPLIRLFGGS